MVHADPKAIINLYGALRNNVAIEIIKIVEEELRLS